MDLGFEGFETAAIAELCAELDVPYTVVKTDIEKSSLMNAKKKIRVPSVPKCAKAL